MFFCQVITLIERAGGEEEQNFYSRHSITMLMAAKHTHKLLIQIRHQKNIFWDIFGREHQHFIYDVTHLILLPTIGLLRQPQPSHGDSRNL